MGGTQSSQKFINDPTSSEAHQILNVIMREMGRRADMIDMYSLADPKRCSQYVVVAGNAIKQLLTKINLEPVKEGTGDKGVMYFKKISDLQNKSSTENCLELAWFFIKIMHIWAAIALSFMDDKLADPYVQTSYPTSIVTSTGQYLSGFEQAGGALTQAGSGSYYLLDNAGLYRILNHFLLVPSDNPVNTSTQPMRFESYSVITISQSELYALNPRVVKNFTGLAGPFPMIQYSLRNPDGTYRNMTALLKLSTLNADSYLDVTLENIILQNKGQGPPAPQAVTEKLHLRNQGDPNPLSARNKSLPAVIIDLFNQAKDIMEPPKFSPIEFLRKFNIISTLDADEVRIEGSSKIVIIDPRGSVGSSQFLIVYTDKIKRGDKTQDVEFAANTTIVKVPNKVSQYRVIIDLESMQTDPEDLKYTFDTRIRSYETFTADERNPSIKPISAERAGLTIPAFLEEVFKSMIKTYSASKNTGLTNTKGIVSAYNSDSIEEPFKVKRLWKALTRSRPVKSHCVARALQLLNVSAIRDQTTGESYSSVCNMKFPYITDSSLPTPGQEVTTSESVYAMAMLFVDKLDGGDFMPRVTQSLEFQSFKTRLKTLFERTGATNIPNSISNIDDKLIDGCRGHTDEKLYIKNKGLSASLRQKAVELINQQMKHTANSMQLLFKLFDEQSLRKGSMKININIIRGGMPALISLGEETRRVLIEYYSNCEETYTDGLMLIQQSLRANPAETEFR